MGMQPFSNGPGRAASPVVLGIAVALMFAAVSGPARAQAEPPIAYSGHGVLFDRSGQPIELTQAFVAEAQKWYRARLMAPLNAQQRKAFAAQEERLRAASAAATANDTQARLIAGHEALEWLIQTAPAANDAGHRLHGHVRALRYALNWRLPEGPGSVRPAEAEPYRAPEPLLQQLDSLRLRASGNVTTRMATMNLGQAYINECLANGVPVPPPINRMDPAGLSGWKSQGFIPTAEQFIVNTPAEVRTYRSTAPDGMCYALPRYTDASKTEVKLDGVICMGRITSKVCFWDNQMNKVGFKFPAGTQIPIGVPDTSIDPQGRYQAGGYELLGGSGDVCTDCHAGENPYITHPRSMLAPGVRWDSLQDPPQSLPTFAVNRYDPIVAAAWPQNKWSQAETTVPGQCSVCHVKGDAGRFPHLSNELPGYCGTVLTQAGARSMPPGSPGSQAAAANAFRDAWCNAPPDASVADTGDPHLRTMNGVLFDFQAAGEFVALRHSDSQFELQTRQTPVLTTFIPGANPYTGLASCVSLNTAVALRMGKNRITYQPGNGDAAAKERLQLRINGRAVPANKRIDLGGGNVISQAGAGGELDVQSGDGTRVVVTPLFWASQGYWYLDVQVLNTPAREGVMGAVLAPEWLPRLPDGSGFGTRPAALADRHVQLNQKFAGGWRVRPDTSMFDYAPGTSTADFTDENWPPEPGKACSASSLKMPLPKVREPRPDLAKKACRGIKDPASFENCLFDVTVLADPSVAKGHKRAEQIKALARP